jgi:hypothetical protein
VGLLRLRESWHQGRPVRRLYGHEENGRMQFDKGSLKISNTPPARAQKTQNSSQSGKSGGGFRRGSGTGGSPVRYDGTGIQNRTNPEDAKRMSFANARMSAIELVKVLLTHDGLPVSGAKTKAGQASRFDEITAAVDKLAVKYYNDGMTLRLLETVADTVTDNKPDGKLPDDEEKTSNGNSDKGGSAVKSDDEGFDEPASGESDPDFDE